MGNRLPPLFDKRSIKHRIESITKPHNVYKNQIDHETSHHVQESNWPRNLTSCTRIKLITKPHDTHRNQIDHETSRHVHDSKTDKERWNSLHKVAVMKLLRNKNPKTARTIQLSEELGPHLDQRKRSINGKFLGNIKKKKKRVQDVVILRRLSQIW